MQFFTALISALVLAVSTTATPVHVAERGELIVVSPTVTSPTENATWPILSQQLVTWDTSKIPPSGRNNIGRILLGYLEDNDPSEHLYWELASGFLITVGFQNVTVPNVPPQNNYVIALFGDSGNLSPEFSIVKEA
ncbi:hypothetical protein EDB85DRAFT_1892527 [Lactarius pseudohatsudake]|nr:hypothetical protein EDB85DRAFT_1892527 [Lactarius pseudohatsudake]